MYFRNGILLIKLKKYEKLILKKVNNQYLVSNNHVIKGEKKWQFKTKIPSKVDASEFQSFLITYHDLS